MIRHIVAWNHRADIAPAQREENARTIKRELEGLQALIPQLISARVVIDPAQSCTRDLLLTCLFADEEALQAYQVHPEHKRVSSFVRSVTQDRVCLDFAEEA